MDVPTAIPMLFYDNVVAAEQWLADAFGLETTVEHGAADGSVMGAEMKLGAGRVMLLGGGDAEFGMRSPSSLGAATGGVYIALDDVDGHHDHAQQAGARIVMPIQDMDYGSREYGALDLEGHYWGFGTYRLA